MSRQARIRRRAAVIPRMTHARPPIGWWPTLAADDVRAARHADEDRPCPGAARAGRNAVAPRRGPAAARAAPSPRRRRRPRRWIDLEVARRRAVAADRNLAHDRVLHRQPLTTLDDHLARGLRVEALAELVDGFAPRGDPGDDDAVLDAADLAFGPPILRPPSLRDFYAFEGHVRTMWERRGGEVPETWYRLPIFYFSNVSEIRGPDEPVWSPAASIELDYELEVAALIDTPVAGPAARSAARRRSAATRSSTTGRPATSSARRRSSGSGPPRARTSRRRSGRGS